EEETLEGDAGGPRGFEGHEVFGVEDEEFALGFEDARVRGEHEAVFLVEKSVGFFGTGKHFVAILDGHEFGVGVFIDDGRGAFAEGEGNALLFELGAIEVGGGGSDVALIAVEDGNLNGDFGDAFPTDSLRDRAEGFVVVFEPTAQPKIRNGLTLGSSDFGCGASVGGIGNARGWSLGGDYFDNLG